MVHYQFLYCIASYICCAHDIRSIDYYILLQNIHTIHSENYIIKILIVDCNFGLIEYIKLVSCGLMLQRLKFI